MREPTTVRRAPIPAPDLFLLAALAALLLALGTPARAQTTPDQGGFGVQRSVVLFGLTNGSDPGVRLDTLGQRHPVAAPWRLVQAAARRALERHGVPVTLVDSAEGIVGSVDFVASRRLGRVFLGEYLDCGRGMSGPAANFMRARMAVVVFARREDATRSTLRTAVAAHGRTLDGASQQALGCTTTGVLEERIRAEVVAAVAEAVQAPPESAPPRR